MRLDLSEHPKIKSILTKGVGLIGVVSFVVAVLFALVLESVPGSIAPRGPHAVDTYMAVRTKNIDEFTAMEIAALAGEIAIFTALLTAAIVIAISLLAVAAVVFLALYLLLLLQNYVNLRDVVVIAVLAVLGNSWYSSYAAAQKPKKDLNFIQPDGLGRSYAVARQVRISLPEVRTSVYQHFASILEYEYCLFLASGKPIKCHYAFPLIDFTMTASQILMLIGPALHEPRFNSILLVDTLYAAAHDKSLPIARVLNSQDLHFKSLKHFKIWFLKQYSHGFTTPRAASKRARHFSREVRRSVRQVFNTSIPRSEAQLRGQISLFTSLPYLLYFTASAITALLNKILWKSYPWLTKAVDEIIKKDPSIDFNSLMYALARTTLKVPNKFPRGDAPQRHEQHLDGVTEQ
ncbi:hypothetical protein Cantr_03185 [Candida viswanathii]|uniref:Uncharacterized protein n=1 Tax=Candida viswanathii TaxID=5486 RepID=A0A367YRH5_9ASCO|nr:hypothetical protein Cantr_03185 [Candida viswanathii]